jgi:hypothetical protein
MAAASTLPHIDLLAWPAVAEARARLDQAEAARETAATRYRLAPWGERQNRLKAFQAASQEALKAQIALDQAVREGSR